MTDLLKKIFLHPFFMPLFFLIAWGGFASFVYLTYGESVLTFTKEGRVIEDTSHLGYIILLAVLLWYCEDFQDKVKSWGMYLFLTMCAFLREEGIHHYLSKTDTTPFKSRFFLNPNNPIGEKIIFGLFLIIVVSAIGYLAVKYAKPLVVKFFKLDVISWSVATLCTVGVASKIIDRFPANYRKAHNGVALSDDVFALMQLIEESSEMFLPYLAILIVLQYHFKTKN